MEKGMGETLELRVGWVIDGSGEAIHDHVFLRIVDGVITEMTRHGQSSSASCLDLSHCTIMPPLIDSHVHLWMSGTVDQKAREEQLSASYEQLHPVISQHLTFLLSHGVLGVREGGHKNGAVLRYREEGVAGPETAIRTRIAGRAWHQRGRYGGLIGRTPAAGETLAEAFQREQEAGDHVKVVQSGLNSLEEYGRETAPQFSLIELKELVVQAERVNKKVMVHANGKEPVRIALEAGCHSIEHGFFMGKENLKLMAAKNVTWVPTVYTMKAYAENMDSRARGSRKIAEKNYRHQLEQLTMARDLGVRIALGTDAGSMGVLHGESVVEELKLFIKAGFTLPEAIRCATLNGANLLEIQEMGLLRVGEPANFIVSRGTPSQLPRKLSYLEAIFLDGEVYSGYRKNPFKVVS